MANKGENRERAIMQAAIRLFRDKGYHATSIRDLAEAVGVQKSALYHYVVSKEDLLFRISHQTFTESVGVMRGLRDATVPWVEKLRRAIDHHVAYVAIRGTATTIFLQDIHALGPEYRDAILTLAREYTALWEEILRRGIESGELRPVDVKMTVMAILGSGNWVATWYTDSGRLSPAEIAGVFMDVYISGLVAPPQVAADASDHVGQHVFGVSLPVRWGDLDGTGTLPAADLLRYCDSAADQMLESVGWGRGRLRAEAGIALVTVRTGTSVPSRIQAERMLDVTVRTTQVTDRTLTLEMEVCQGGRGVGRVELVVEAREAQTGLSLPLPPSLRSALAPPAGSAANPSAQGG